MLVYCDSVILIYFFDHTGRFNSRAMNRLAALAAAKDRIAFTDLVRLEYRIAPLRNEWGLRMAKRLNGTGWRKLRATQFAHRPA